VFLSLGDEPLNGGLAGLHGPRGGDWVVAYRVLPQDGQPVIGEIRIVPRPRDQAEADWLRVTLEDPDIESEWVRCLGRGGAEIRSSPARCSRGWTLSPRGEGRHPNRTGDRGVAALRKGLSGRPNWALENERFMREMLQAPHRPGRRGRPDRFYAEIASAYGTGWCKPGVVHQCATSPDVSRNRGLHYAEAAGRELVHEARKRGMLTQADVSPKEAKALINRTDTSSLAAH